MNWYIGQKIVCVNDEWEAEEGVPVGLVQDPIRGNIYTIRDIDTHQEDDIGFRLEEIINPPFEDFETTFNEKAFKPVRTTSISIFAQMLEQEPVS